VRHGQVKADHSNRNREGWPDEFGKKLYRTVLHRFFVYEYYGGRKPTIELIHRGEAIDLYRLWEAMDPYKFLLDKRFDFEDAFEDSN